MDSSKITTVTGRGIPVRGNDIDTDRIVPARYLKEITFSRMGEYPFFDERYDEKGGLKEHPFNRDEFQGASILFVNENFGCGSSREHAPQALKRWGIQAIIGVSFAEIFAGNCTMLGIPVFTAGADQLDGLQCTIEKKPATHFSIDVEKGTVSWENETRKLGISEAARSALMTGTWDSTSVLLENLQSTREIISRIPYIGWT